MTTFDSKTVADAFVKNQQDKHADPDAFRGYEFPLPWFMKVIGGWGREWVSFVCGRAGRGKSSVLTTAVTHLGLKGHKFLYVSLEETLFTVTQRIFSNLQDIDRTSFRDITLKPSDWTNVYTAAKQMGDFQGYWAYGLYTEKEIVEAIQQVQPTIFVFDYLQLGDWPGQTGQEKNAWGSKFMTRIAKGAYTNKQPISVICAAQLNDNNEILHSREPERDGDICIDIADIDDGAGGVLKDRKHLRIRKFRHGMLASTDVAFYGGRSKIAELPSGSAYTPIPPKPAGAKP